MNYVFLSAQQKNFTPEQAKAADAVMQAQLMLLGLSATPVSGWYGGQFEESFMVPYRTDHELHQLKRLAAAHKQEAILVLENVRVLPEGTIASGGLEFYTRPNDGYYHGEHTEQLIEFNRSRPDGDCTQLPSCMGGLYITVKGS